MSDEFVNDIDSIIECDDFELTHSQLSTIMLLLENFPYSKAASKDCTTFKDAFNIVITNKFSQKQKNNACNSYCDILVVSMTNRK